MTAQWEVEDSNTYSGWMVVVMTLTPLWLTRLVVCMPLGTNHARTLIPFTCLLYHPNHWHGHAPIHPFTSRGVRHYHSIVSCPNPNPAYVDQMYLLRYLHGILPSIYHILRLIFYLGCQYIILIINIEIFILWCLHKIELESFRHILIPKKG